MLIALLALLGVNLIVVVALLAGVLTRKRWVRRQPGAFRGAIRVTRGEVDGLSAKWRRGYGRWVRDSLVWTKAPLLLRNEVLAADLIDENRPASAEHVKRLGDHPLLMELRIGGATVEVAAGKDDRNRLVGPGRKPSAKPPPAANELADSL
jgi:hypothetical protein